MAASKLLKQVRAIFFDAVGTLLHPFPSAPEVYTAVGRRFGSCLELVEISGRFHHAFARQESFDHANKWQTSEEREVQRWRTIVAEVLDDVSDSSACFQALYEHFERPEAWRCDPETSEVLQGLAERGFTLGLASNYDHRLRRVAAGLPPLHPISILAISSEIGWRKPAPEFFSRLCQMVRLSPQNVLLVGDDRANDYTGAFQSNLRALLFDPSEQKTQDGLTRITHLSDLLTDKQ